MQGIFAAPINFLKTTKRYVIMQTNLGNQSRKSAAIRFIAALSVAMLATVASLAQPTSNVSNNTVNNTNTGSPYWLNWSGSYNSGNGPAGDAHIINLTTGGANRGIAVTFNGYMRMGGNGAGSVNQVINLTATGANDDISVYFTGTLLAPNGTNTGAIVLYNNAAANIGRYFYTQVGAGSYIQAPRGIVLNGSQPGGWLIADNAGWVDRVGSGANPFALDIRSTTASGNTGASNVAVANSGTITAGGASADGIHVDTYGNITVGGLVPGTIGTNGIFTPTGDPVVIVPLTGVISATGANANAINVQETGASVYTNNVAIYTAATITATGNNATGITVDYSSSGVGNRSNVLIDNRVGGTITTTGNNANDIAFTAGNRNTITGTINNSGRIINNTAGASAVFLNFAQNGTNNFTVNNNAGASITSNGAAIQLTGSTTGTGLNTATINNSGSLAGTVAISIDKNSIASGTIYNTGYLNGTSGIAVAINSGTTTLGLGNGSVINGNLYSSGTNNKVILSGSATTAANFTSSAITANFSSLTVQSDGTHPTNWTLNGARTQIDAVNNVIINGASSTLNLNPIGSGAYVFSHNLTGNGVLAINLLNATDMISLGAPATVGTAFAGTFRAGNGRYNLDATQKSMLQLATLSSGSGNTMTMISGSNHVGGFSFDGGMVVFDISTSGSNFANNWIDTGALTLNGGKVAVDPNYLNGGGSGATALPLLQQDEGTPGKQLVRATSIAGSVGSLILTDTFGNAIATTSASSAIVQNNIVSGLANNSGTVAIGYYGTGILQQADGLYLSAGQLLQLDLQSGYTTVLNADTTAIAGAAELHAQITGAGSLYIAANQAITLNGGNNNYTGTTTAGTGTLILGVDGAFGNTAQLDTLSGAVVDINGKTQSIGYYTGSTGSKLLINGGALTGTNSSAWLIDGIVDATVANSFISAPAGLNVGNNSTTGDVRVGSNGVVDAGLIAIGNNTNASGTVTIQDTAYVSATNGVSFGAGSGQLNLNGGLLNTLSLASASTGTANFNSGTLQANADNANFISGFNSTGLNIQNGGAYIDSNGFSIATNANNGFSGNGTGGLNKIGTGTLTLNGTSNYTGGTQVDDGSLVLATAANNSTAAIGTGTLNIAADAAAYVAPTVSTPSYTFANGLAGAASSLFDVNLLAASNTFAFDAAGRTTGFTGTANFRQSTYTLTNGDFTNATLISAAGNNMIIGTTMPSGSNRVADFIFNGGTVNFDVSNNGPYAAGWIDTGALKINSGAIQIDPANIGSSGIAAIPLLLQDDLGIGSKILVHSDAVISGDISSLQLVDLSGNIVNLAAMTSPIVQNNTALVSSNSGTVAIGTYAGGGLIPDANDIYLSTGILTDLTLSTTKTTVLDNIITHITNAGIGDDMKALIHGTGTLWILDSGIGITLTGSNNNTGGIVINQGTLIAANLTNADYALGAANNTIYFNNAAGSKLLFAASTTMTQREIVQANSVGTLDAGAGNTLTVTAAQNQTNGSAVLVNTNGTFNSVGNITYANNTATGTGGAIYVNTGGALNFASGTISFLNNKATGGHGGAIYAAGNLNIAGSGATLLLQNNTATTNGGAIYTNGTASITGNYDNILIASNTANNAGGAIYSGNYSLNISTTTSGTFAITGNNAPASGGSALYGADVNITGNYGSIVMDSNKTGLGGGVIVSTGLTTGITINTLTSGVFAVTNNVAATGGGAFISGATPFSLSGTYGGILLSSNTAATSGGGVISAGAVTISATTSGTLAIIKNTAAGGSPAGAIVSTGTLAISGNYGDILIASNAASTYGGALLASYDVVISTTTARTLALTDNKAGSAYGGSAYTGAGNIKITGNYGDMLISSNTAGQGGGALAAFIGTTTIDSTVTGTLSITKNTVTTGNGGALYSGFADYGGDIVLAGTYGGILVSSNTAFASGGAFYGNNNVTINALTTGTLAFTNNTAGSNGGAIYSGSLFRLTGVYGGILIDHNKAGGAGGAIYASNGLIISATDDFVASNNVATGNGGAFYSGSDILMTGSYANILVNSNTATGGQGGAIYSVGNVTISTTTGGTMTFSNNTALTGGAIYTGSSFLFTLADNGTMTATGNNAGATDANGGFLYTNSGSMLFNTGSNATATIGDATSIANHTDSIATSGSSVNLYKQGNGTLILNAYNTYTGTTFVNGGRLAVNGYIGSFQTFVAASSTLAGTGTAAGNVTILNAGHFAPGNSPGTFTVGGTLTLNNGANLDFDLNDPTRTIPYPSGPRTPQATNDLIKVNGDVILVGTSTLNINSVSAFARGEYDLINFDGTRTGGAPNITIGDVLVSGSTWTAADKTKLTILDNEPQWIKLAYDLTLGVFNYWDGTNSALWADGTASGGNGTWYAKANTLDTFWTTNTGSTNGEWADSEYAIFKGASGTVAVDDSRGNVNFSGAQFQTDGYLLTGGTLFMSGSYANIELNTNLAVTTTIATQITGTYNLAKEGGGTLVLAGNNDYTGATIVDAGKLLVNGLISSTGATTVNIGSILGGTGTIAGPVSITAGAMLTGGDIGTAGTLHTGSLSLDNASLLIMDLGKAGTVGGPLNDLIEVNGSLILSGTLNVATTPSGTFTAGVYRLIDYTTSGGLTNNTLHIGTIPSTGTQQAFVQTSIDKQVNLIFLGTNSGGPTPGNQDPTGLNGRVNYWDGSGLANDGVVAGGSGTWQAWDSGRDNWTTGSTAPVFASGSLNAPWQDYTYGFFTNVGGTVQVDNSFGNVKLGGATFEVGGYNIQGAPITIGGTSSIVLNTANSGTTTIASVLTDSGSNIGITKTGTGALALTGTNTYTGDTLVNAGKLIVDGVIAGSATTAANTTLAGTGNIAGAVNVSGTLAPADLGTTGTLHTGALTLNNNAVLAMDLGQANVPGGALNDLVSVNGALVLGGTVNVTPSIGGSFTTGVYRLIDYTTSGGLTDNTLHIGAIPTTGTQQAFVQTSIDKQVNLIFLGTNSGGPNPGNQDPTGLNGRVNNWDGSGTANDGVIAGGSGTWQAWDSGRDNWTTGSTAPVLASGSLNAPWQDYTYAYFTNVGGTVQVDNAFGNVKLGGATFEVGGYTIQGNPITIGGTTSIVLNTANTGTTTIASVLTDSGSAIGLTKTGSGALALTGTNTYTGLTTLAAGKLIVNGVIAGSATTAANTTLAGNGNIIGAVNVTGTLAPGDLGTVGTLHTGALTLNNNAVLAMDLGQANVPGGALNDLIEVNGALVLGGTVNVNTTPGGSFTTGVYRLIDYTASGGLTNNTLHIGTIPSTGTQQAFVQTSVDKQVNLIFLGTNSGGPNPGNEDPTGLNGRVNYWDGSGIANDGVVAGGSGTWQAWDSGRDNWTTGSTAPIMGSGSLNAPWQDYTYAYFTNVGGTVQVDNAFGNVKLGGATFEVGGYTIQGNPITIGGTTSIVLNTANTGTTTIKANLTDGGIATGVTKNGAGTLILDGHNTYTGDTAVNAGKLLVNGDNASGATIATGATLGGTGTIGGNVSIANNATLQPGSDGVGTLIIGGTLALSANTILDYQYGQAGVRGGPLNDLVKVGGDLILGGQINITETPGGVFGRGVYGVFDYTGTLTNNTLAIGNFSGTSLFDINQVYVDTSINHQVNLVNLGTANYNWWDGAAASNKNNGSIDGGNGTWQGSTGNNNWTLSPDADLNAAWQNAAIAVFSASSGTVTVDSMTSGPVVFGGMVFSNTDANGYLITGGTLVMGGTNPNIGMNVNPLVTATIASTISGSQNLVKYNDGTLVLSGTSDYTGSTAVNGGKLLVDGQLSGTGAVNVSTAATLGGNGTINGSVSIANGGTLAPGDNPGAAGHLTIGGSLSLAQTSVLDYNLGQANVPGGANNDLTTVGGALTLDGQLNVTQSQSGTFTVGTYRLIDYTGALTNNTLDIASLPIIGTNIAQHAFIQTSVANQVNLVYLGSGSGGPNPNNPDPTDLNGKVNNWDGSGAANDGTISGGSGTWQAWASGRDNWTTGSNAPILASGSLNAPWQDYTYGVFGGLSSGTVTVDNSQGQVTLGGADFNLAGYVITGGSIAIGGTSDIALNTANSGTTTIDSVLAGNSGLIKTGSGALVLDAANTYTGTTYVAQGKLVDNGVISGPLVSGSGAILAGTGTIIGPVNILNGSTLAPGDIGKVGTITTGALTLNNNSVLAMELGQANVPGGALNDLIVTKGDLVLDGTLNVAVSTGGTFGGGLYRIDNYSGTLTNNILDLGTLPTPNTGENYFVQTSVANQVNLFYFGGTTSGTTPYSGPGPQDPNDPNNYNGKVNYWDGGGKSNDNIVAGGNGTWKSFASGSDNWTVQSGSINAPWQRYTYAMFTANSGTVTVDNTSGQVTLGGADFTVPNYLITGGSIAIGGTANIALNTVNSGTTTIASILTDSGSNIGLIKTGSGTLVLTATNTFTGTTAVAAGKLVATNLNATGAAAIATVANGATLEFNGATGTMTQVVTGSGSLDFARSTLAVASENTANNTNIKQGSIITTTGTAPFKTTGNLTIDATSRLNLGVNNTQLGNVTNAGMIAFSAPATAGAAFKTANIASLTGSGTLLFNVDFSKVLSGPNAALAAADYLTISGSSSGAHTVAISGTNTTIGAEVRSVPLITNLTPAQATATYKLLNGPLAVGLNKFDIMQGDASELLPNAASWYLADKGISELGDAIIDTAAIGAIEWGMNLDSLHQRMGDVRQETIQRKDGDENAERVNTQTGNVWIRGRGYGLNAMNSLSGNSFRETAYGVTGGADKAFATQQGVNLLGGFVDMGNVDRQFVNNGSGSSQNFSAGVYLTLIRDSGWFADIVGRVDRYKNKIESHDVNGLVTNATYNSQAQGLSAEVGKHLQRKDGWWLEPILMVSAVWVNGVNYDTTPTMRKVHVDIDGSMTTSYRAQVRFGRQWQNSRWYPYGKFAAVAVDSDAGEIKSGGRTYDLNFSGKRIEFGVGTSYKINSYSQLYFDYEYAKAPAYEKPWSLNLGYRRLW